MELENRMVIDSVENRKRYGVCEQCGEDIYFGDEIVIDQMSGNILHKCCEDGHIDDLIDSNFMEAIAGED